MAAALRSVSSANNFAASSTLTFSEPSGAQPGDILFLFVYNASTTIPTLPTGWTLLQTSGTTGKTFRLGYIVRGASAPSLIAGIDSSAGGGGDMLCISGATATGVVVSSATTANTATPDPPAVTATSDGGFTVGCATHNAGGGTWTVSAPYAWVGTGNGGYGAVEYRAAAPTGSNDPPSMTPTAGVATSHMITAWFAAAASSPKRPTIRGQAVARAANF
jgi:hypothetical protein